MTRCLMKAVIRNCNAAFRTKVAFNKTSHLSASWKERTWTANKTLTDKLHDNNPNTKAALKRDSNNDKYMSGLGLGLCGGS